MDITSCFKEVSVPFNGIGAVCLGAGLAIASTVLSQKVYRYFTQSNNALNEIVHDRTVHHPQFPAKTCALNISESDVFKEHLSIPVFNKISNKFEEVEVVYKEIDEEHYFNAVKNGKILGRLIARKFERISDNEFGCPALIVQMEASYGNEKGEIPKIEIVDLVNKDKTNYKYVGYGLVKVLMKKFQEQVQSRVDLHAAWDSHAFYWKLGFRPVDQEKIELMASKVLKPNGKSLGTVKMYLPEWARDAWNTHLNSGV